MFHSRFRPRVRRLRVAAGILGCGGPPACSSSSFYIRGLSIFRFLVLGWGFLEPVSREYRERLYFKFLNEHLFQNF